MQPGLPTIHISLSQFLPLRAAQALSFEPGTHITSTGALATRSGAKMGRSPKDKRVTRDPETEKDLWWGPYSPNYVMDDRTFLTNRERAVDYLNTLERVYVVDAFVNWDPASRLKVRVVTSRAYHALFMSNMLIRPTAEELANFGEPDFIIYNAGAFPANKYTNFMTSQTSIDLSLKHKEMVILGTMYAGEMKKGVFTLMHYLMPMQGKLSLHSGCNVGAEDDVTLFFGLSGTGKTTLSADPKRPLIGDDEHVWSDNGVFNIEGGCYAKCIGLTEEREPEIWKAIKFGTVLENVEIDPATREVDYESQKFTENTRASYPIEYMANARIPCVGGHPKNVILLACDAFGVLPPVSRLTLEQAMYHFISGYTAKVAGTEVGVTEPQATFSACFGSAFLMLHPYKYATMLAEKMAKHGTTAWLLNTGWTGGKYGVGKRMSLKHTRAIIDAIHSGELDQAEFVTTPIFGLQVPTSISGVPSEVLCPENVWGDKNEFATTLNKLGHMFVKNFEHFHDGDAFVGADMAARILTGGPKPLPEDNVAKTGFNL
ncbi:phosphoenolpyruvate carboxykinase [Volvox carteri f. nagariensis]|uniref:phosphoenolpyruvate carboxykinase (ATP) n=2 Tax=Volvox carteri f. nagariensis TaxID=3068 RepID=D8TYH8_VOLCA|nr:phosphoenolpyruvate carboxykinase [Volvox carteri f. nagariensis]EFJ47556.1 phosphoenolpyruvate carboxykinase [Volvox carteri f. nagariensis]|eukprot:XP_002951380.1 phosphoenolpyruvate carboxykinase [Volvox carteri f. nagariensis]